MGLINAGTRATAAGIVASLGLFVIKGSDESLVSSTTMQNDNELVIPVNANATYAWHCFLYWEGGTRGSSDIKWQWVIPSGSAMAYQAIYENLSGTIVQNAVTNAAVNGAGSGGAGVIKGISMTGSLVVSSTAGSQQLQWAQSTSNATATIVHALSKLEMWRVS